MTTTTTTEQSTAAPRLRSATGAPSFPRTAPAATYSRRLSWRLWAGVVLVVLVGVLLSSTSSFSAVSALAPFSFSHHPPGAPIYGPPERRITKEELAKHIVKTSAWVAIDGQVWDVTNTISKHPAGPGLIIENVGSDITALFAKHHHREGLLGLLESQNNRIKRVGVLLEPEWERSWIERLWKQW